MARIPCKLMTKDAPIPEDPPSSGATGDSPAEEQETPEEGPAATPAPPGETGTASSGDPAESEPPRPAEESRADSAGFTEETTEDRDSTDPSFTAAGGGEEPGDSRPDIPDDRVPPKGPPRRAPWIKGVLDLCLVLILAGLAGAVYLLYQMQLDQDQIILAEVDRVESRLNDLEARPQQDPQARRSLQVLDKKLKSLRQRQGEMQRRQDRDLHQLKEQMATLAPAGTAAAPGAIPLGPDVETAGTAEEPASADALASASAPAPTEEAAGADSGPPAETEEALDGSLEEEADSAEVSAAGEEMDADAPEVGEGEPPSELAAATDEPGTPNLREPEAEPAVTPPKDPQQKYIEFVESTAHQLWGWVKETAFQLWDWIVRKLQGAWQA